MDEKKKDLSRREFIKITGFAEGAGGNGVCL